MSLPVLFIGHGSPMNLIEENPWTRAWAEKAAALPKPQAVLMISAHWYTAGSRLQTAPEPEMIYDMYGFPEALYRLKYKARTSPKLIAEVKRRLTGVEPLAEDAVRGYDHGNYAVLFSMYPAQDIPVVQLSVNYEANARQWFRIGQALAPLREQGVLIIGSGNIVHNLRALNPQLENAAYPEARAFDQWIQDMVRQLAAGTENAREVLADLFRWKEQAGAALAAAFPDHLAPFFYSLGAALGTEPASGGPAHQVDVFCRDYLWGSLSMTSFKWS